MLGFLAGNPHTGKTLLGVTPLFGLDPVLREGDRAVGPLTAIWFVGASSCRCFLFTPDVPAACRCVPRCATASRRSDRRCARCRATAAMATFLIANMIYTDGMLALFAFGGIYAAGTFGWGTIQIGVFGILLNITAMIGAYLGGKLDDRFGSKRVILGSLAMLIVSVIGFLSIGRDYVLFVVPADPPVPGAPMFSGAGEKLYVAIGLVIGLVVGPAQAASRTLLVRLAPEGRITQFFGLLALSGKVTSFMGPLLRRHRTAASRARKPAWRCLFVFFAVGALILSRVNAGSAASR